jgi:hypothetical protein
MLVFGLEGVDLDILKRALLDAVKLGFDATIAFVEIPKIGGDPRATGKTIVKKVNADVAYVGAATDETDVSVSVDLSIALEQMLQLALRVRCGLTAKAAPIVAHPDLVQKARG